MLTSEAARRIAEYTIANRGGTFDAETGEPVTPASGYAVAVQNIAETGGLLSRTDIVDRLLSIRGKPGIPYVGTWVEENAYGNDVCYIDRVIILPDEDSAVILARAFGEQAIWDFADGDTVYVNREAA